MQELRKPFFYLAIALCVIVILVELGATAILVAISGATTNATEAVSSIAQQANDFGDPEVSGAFSDLSQSEKDKMGTLADQENPPGLGIPYLALIDGVLVLTIGLMGVALLAPPDVYSRVHGLVSCFTSCLMVLGGIVMIITAILLLFLMVGLLLAVPFGTLAYLALYGFFPRGGASVTLGLLMALKLGFAVSLILAQQRFLQNKALVLMVASSIICNVIVSFLHAFVPGILVSITDAIAGIIVALCGVIWAVFVLINAIPAILKALKPKGG